MEKITTGMSEVYKLTEVDLSDMLVMPEELVAGCSEQISEMYGPDYADNNFAIILAKGKFLRKEGRTPVYLCTQDMSCVYVTTVERINKQYH